MIDSEPLPRPLSGTQPENRRAHFFLAVATFLALVGLSVVAAPRAGALTNAEELTRFGSIGGGAGQLEIPRGTATDPVTGHVFIADNGGNYGGRRITEFTPWGAFVKAFGLDVAPGSVNEQQEVRVRASTGQLKLSFGASATADLPFDASGLEIEAALNGLASIGPGGSVSVKEVTGTANGITPYIYVVTFKGSLVGTDVAELTIANGATPLSGGAPSTTLEVRTRADGTAGGTGLESCTEESGCKGGVAGDGPGAIDDPFGVAVDGEGALSVREYNNNRIQKFDSAGRFLLMFGGGVNQTTGEDLCTDEDIEVDNDTCGAGTIGSGQGEFIRSFDIALGADGTAFVADNERIEEFEPDGAFKGEVPVPGEVVRQLAINPQSGGFFAVFGDGPAAKDNVRKLSPSGTLEGSCDIKSPGVLAGDPAGNLYVVSEILGKKRVLEFDPSCNQVASLAEGELVPGGTNGLRFDLTGLGTNAAGNLYVANTSVGLGSFIRAFGPGPAGFEAPPKVPPTIVGQFATSIERDGAILGAEINPHFWSNTTYSVQYGTGKCSEGGCGEEKPVAPGAALTSKVVEAPVKSAGIFLEGLQSGTIYHYRFLAQSGGGSVVGSEHSFITYPAAQAPKSSCPNQAFRTGFSTPLPNCRAFEMVSPLDKNNGDIRSLIDLSEYTTGLEQSSDSGDRFTYSSYRSFANPKAAPYTIQYMANRQSGLGWQSEAIVPAQGPATSLNLGYALENPYKAFSADLCNGWLVIAAEPVLDGDTPEGFLDFYRRDNCGGEGYEALLSAPEPNVGPIQFEPELQGTSADGKKAIIRIIDKLTPDAASGIPQTYYSSGRELHLVCILPSGLPSDESCSGGTGSSAAAGGPTFNRRANVTHAISNDGSRVYWTASAKESGPGKIYLRLNPDQEQSALSGEECTEPEKACTLEVSETASSKQARFLAASADGSKAIFEVTEGTLAGNLYEFDLEAGVSTLIGKHTIGLLGAGEDLSQAYFASTEASAEAIGEGAVKGSPNLYLYREGESNFIAALSAADVGTLVTGAATPSNTYLEPVFHIARASADGSRLVFVSTESLTGYDNTDQATGKADSEVYLYEAGAAGPVCVSCNPSGARPLGRDVHGFRGRIPTAATIPLPQYQLNQPRALSPDGRRLFFTSYDGLLPGDTNGRADVYEWQAADGPSDCKERGAELYVPSSEGCLSLISSGQSPVDSEFRDASADSRDVFFTTNASLLPQDPGLIDI